MGKMKNFDPALYRSHFEAVRGFIQEGRIESYDFNVCTKQAAENALAYLCVNNIPHSYHKVGAFGIYCVTISWEEGKDNYGYCFWCEEDV